MGRFVRDVMKLSAESRNVRVCSPDGLASNRLGVVREVADRAWMGEPTKG
jgi:phosphoketolase